MSPLGSTFNGEHSKYFSLSILLLFVRLTWCPKQKLLFPDEASKNDPEKNKSDDDFDDISDALRHEFIWRTSEGIEKATNPRNPSSVVRLVFLAAFDAVCAMVCYVESSEQQSVTW